MMGILSFLDKLELDNLRPEEYENFASRRDALNKLSIFSKKAAIAAMPIGILSALPKMASAATNDEVIDTLNFALTLEYLESEYYKMGLSSNVIPADEKAMFQQIGKHEDAHVTFLADTISSLGGSPVAKPTFDFTAGGTFNPFNVYEEFLALSQAFEDTGVRAYKGQAGNLLGSPDVLTAALQIHSVEARHASQVRRLRTKRDLDTAKGWITGESRGTLPPVTQGVYNGEQNTVHAGIDVTTVTSVPVEGVQEAWDEPLSKEAVLAIASLFIQ